MCDSRKGNNVALNSKSEFRSKFYSMLHEFYKDRENTIKKLWDKQRVDSVVNIVKQFKKAIDSQQKTVQYYYYGRKYDVIDTDRLIFKRKSASDSIVEIVPAERFFDILDDAHVSTSHGGRDKMINVFKNKYLIPKCSIGIYLQLCPVCVKKRYISKTSSKRSLTPNNLNSRGEFNLIDLTLTPDKDYNWLMRYEESATKFCFLRPLKTRTSAEVAMELLKIFLQIGYPLILQSDETDKFKSEVIKILMDMWPACKISKGKALNKDKKSLKSEVENMLNAWINENSSDWSMGCHFIQWQRNTSYDPIVKLSPYRLLFGVDPKTGSKSTSFSSSETEDELENFLRDEKRNDLEITKSEIKNVNETVTVELAVESPEQIFIKHEIDVDADLCYVCNVESQFLISCWKCSEAIHVKCGKSMQDDNGYEIHVICKFCYEELVLSEKEEPPAPRLKRKGKKMDNIQSKRVKGINYTNVKVVQY